jgi:hypothetical protein
VAPAWNANATSEHLGSGWPESHAANFPLPPRRNRHAQQHETSTLLLEPCRHPAAAATASRQTWRALMSAAENDCRPSTWAVQAMHRPGTPANWGGGSNRRRMLTERHPAGAQDKHLRLLGALCCFRLPQNGIETGRKREAGQPKEVDSMAKPRRLQAFSAACGMNANRRTALDARTNACNVARLQGP